MRKPIKALGMALIAATAVLAAVNPFRGRTSGPAAGYQEFSGCPAPSAEGSDRVSAACWRETVETYESMQSAFAELTVAFCGGLSAEINLGSVCYVGEDGMFSVFTRELLTMPSIQNPIDSKISSEARSHSTNSTNSPHEQSQLKDCLA